MNIIIKRFSINLFFVFSILVLMSCTSDNNSVNEENNTEPQVQESETNEESKSGNDADEDNPLADTEWVLVEFQSMDDTQGTTKPSDPSLYTMKLNKDGTVNMKLNCNRANGSWSIEPSSDKSNGKFEFGPLATTKALCPPPSMDEQIAANSKWVRGYLIKEGNLYLSLMADGGIYVWKPATENETNSLNEPNTETEEASPADAKVPGTEYHATSVIPCSMTSEQPTGSCSLGVIREGNGSGIVTITKPDGHTRSIFFEKGNAIGYDQSQADTGEFKAEKKGDLNIIHIGEERYEFPDAVVFGG